MPRVMIQCRSSGEPVPTARSMAPEAFSQISGRFASRCLCGAIHHWRKEDAWLEAGASTVVGCG